jgi:hypothetical protein
VFLSPAAEVRFFLDCSNFVKNSLFVKILILYFEATKRFLRCQQNLAKFNTLRTEKPLNFQPNMQLSYIEKFTDSKFLQNFTIATGTRAF